MGGAGDGGGPATLATPLELSGDASTEFSFKVAGKFLLVAPKSSDYQLSRWFDLGTSDSLNLSDNNLLLENLYEGWALADSIQWYTYKDVTSSAGAVTDQTPVRAVLVSSVRLPTAGGVDVVTEQTIYASGRVSVTTLVANNQDVDVQLTGSEYHHLTVSESLEWAGANLGTHGAIFSRTMGAQPFPNVLIANLGPETGLGADHTYNRYWDGGPFALAPTDSHVAVGELVVYPSGMSAGEAQEHVTELRDPGLEISMGATFSRVERGAYVVSVTGTPVQLGTSATHARMSPAFVLEGWTSPAWEIRRGGAVQASNDAPIGPDVIARYDEAAHELMFEYIGTIPAGAPAEDTIYEVVVP